MAKVYANIEHIAVSGNASVKIYASGRIKGSFKPDVCNNTLILSSAASSTTPRAPTRITTFGNKNLIIHGPIYINGKLQDKAKPKRLDKNRYRLAGEVKISSISTTNHATLDMTPCLFRFLNKANFSATTSNHSTLKLPCGYYKRFNLTAMDHSNLSCFSLYAVKFSAKVLGHAKAYSFSAGEITDLSISRYGHLMLKLEKGPVSMESSSECKINEIRDSVDESSDSD